MPDVVKTIGAGQDYTTIASWESNLDTDHDSGYVRGDCIGQEFAESFSIAHAFASSITDYAWLNGQSGARHDGRKHSDSAHGGARIVYSGDPGGEVVAIDDDYVRISNLEIGLTGTPGNSDEGIDYNGYIGILIERCIIWTDSTQINIDGIYTSDGPGELCIHNCAIIGWDRAGQQVQQRGGSAVLTNHIRMDYCTIHGVAASTPNYESCMGLQAQDADATSNCDVYNTVSNNDSFDQTVTINANGTKRCMTMQTINGPSSVNGSHNAVSDASHAGEFTALTDSVFNIVVADLYVDSDRFDPNLNIKDTSSDLYDAGTDRTAATPDSRADLSTDIVGNARTTDDIGAFAYVAAGGGGVTGARTEDIDLDETMSATLALKATVSDAINLAGAYQTFSSITAFYAEALTLGETKTARKDMQAAISEGLDIGDGAGTAGAIIAALAENLGLGGNFSALKNIAAAYTEGLDLNESWTKRADLQALFDQDILVNENFVSLAEGVTLAALTEDTALTNAFTTNLQALASTTSDLTLAQTFGGVIKFLRALAENIELGDLYELQMDLEGVISENISLSDSYAYEDGALGHLMATVDVKGIVSAVIKINKV